MKRKKPKPLNLFDAFNPLERTILRVLLQNHSNSVSEISCAHEIWTSAYTALIEELLAEESGVGQ